MSPPVDPEHKSAAPARVRVTAPRTRSRRHRPAPSALMEIDAQSEIGEVYLRSLLRAQLRLAARILVILVVVVGGLPIGFLLAPGLARREVLGMPLSWCLLAFALYPVLFALGWSYVRRAERNERDFTAVVGDPGGDTTGAP